MKKPGWLTDHEWEQRLRDEDARLEYETYHQPEYVKKIARVLAITFVSAFIAVAILGMLAGAFDIVFGG